MKLAVALLVVADLLVRGAAVPHVHAPDAGDHARSLRPHVHVTWHTDDKGHSHHESHDGLTDGHAGQSHANHHRHDAPEQDDTVIYLDGGVMMFTAADQVTVVRSVVSWITPGMDAPCGNRAAAACMPVAGRPPGERTASIHDLLPHVLRI